MARDEKKEGKGNADAVATRLAQDQSKVVPQGFPGAKKRDADESEEVPARAEASAPKQDQSLMEMLATILVNLLSGRGFSATPQQGEGRTEVASGKAGASPKFNMETAVASTTYNGSMRQEKTSYGVSPEDPDKDKKFAIAQYKGKYYSVELEAGADTSKGARPSQMLKAGVISLNSARTDMVIKGEIIDSARVGSDVNVILIDPPSKDNKGLRWSDKTKPPTVLNYAAKLAVSNGMNVGSAIAEHAGYEPEMRGRSRPDASTQALDNKELYTLVEFKGYTQPEKNGLFWVATNDAGTDARHTVSTGSKSLIKFKSHDLNRPFTVEETAAGVKPITGYGNESMPTYLRAIPVDDAAKDSIARLKFTPIVVTPGTDRSSGPSYAHGDKPTMLTANQIRSMSLGANSPLVQKALDTPDAPIAVPVRLSADSKDLYVAELIPTGKSGVGFKAGKDMLNLRTVDYQTSLGEYQKDLASGDLAIRTVAINGDESNLAFIFLRKVKSEAQLSRLAANDHQAPMILEEKETKNGPLVSGVRFGTVAQTVEAQGLNDGDTKRTIQREKRPAIVSMDQALGREIKSVVGKDSAFTIASREDALLTKRYSEYSAGVLARGMKDPQANREELALVRGMYVPTKDEFTLQNKQLRSMASPAEWLGAAQRREGLDYSQLQGPDSDKKFAELMAAAQKGKFNGLRGDMLRTSAGDPLANPEFRAKMGAVDFAANIARHGNDPYLSVGGRRAMTPQEQVQYGKIQEDLAKLPKEDSFGPIRRDLSAKQTSTFMPSKLHPRYGNNGGVEIITERDANGVPTGKFSVGVINPGKTLENREPKYDALYTGQTLMGIAKTMIINRDDTAAKLHIYSDTSQAAVIGAEVTNKKDLVLHGNVKVPEKALVVRSQNTEPDEELVKAAEATTKRYIANKIQVAAVGTKPQTLPAVKQVAVDDQLPPPLPIGTPAGPTRGNYRG